MKFKLVLSTLLLAIILPPGLLPAQATSYPNVPPLLVGAAWYPEQWPESRWEEDLRLMEAANIHLVRIAEFAWSAMEPSEGDYELDWVERAVNLAAKHHIAVVLGTPTAAPPAWLTKKYPETLRVDENGKRDEHGNRQQFSFASHRYRELCSKIAEQMAIRLGHNPNVVGWQLDNEYASDSFDPEARDQFHAWLKNKYKTLDNINRKWTTAYWSETYDSWDEIPVRSHEENPGLLLDWRHFVSDTWRSYSINQIEVIKPHSDPRQFITTNTMGWFNAFDHYTLHQVLDIAAWDDYVRTDHFEPIDNAAIHDLVRGFKRKNFWVMETEPAFVNWRRNNTPIEKGQLREMAWQAVGHGADAVEYWQWRSALNGQEQYHGVLLGADGTPVPAYDEVKQIGAEFSKAGAALAGTTPRAQVAILNSYDSRWAIDFQRHNQDFDPVAELLSFYRPLRIQAQAVDIISPEAPLTGYKLIIAPGLNVLSQEVAERLIEYVKQGGTLVLGPRSGMKDEFNTLNAQRQPGPLVELLGGRVEQFYSLGATIPVSGELGTGTASIWAEELSAKDASTKTMLRYGASNGWLDNKAAVITHKVGKGSITYVGAWLDDNLLNTLTSSLLAQTGVEPILKGTPSNVEVCQRSDSRHSLLIVINHNKGVQHIDLHADYRDVLKGTSKMALDLPGYGVAVLEHVHH